MKILKFIVLLLFINTITLPTVAIVMDWDMAVTNSMNISEEEENSLQEDKQPPQYFSVPYAQVFIQKKESNLIYTNICIKELYLPIFSPPPEI